MKDERPVARDLRVHRSRSPLYFILVGEALACLLVTACGVFFISKVMTAAKQKRDREAAVPVASFRAAILWAAYGENVIAADQKYTGQFVQVHDTVTFLDKDASGRYRIGMLLQFGKIGTSSVVCYVAPERAAEFASVQVHQGLTVIGKVKGRKSNSSAYEGYIVEIEDCRIVKP